MSEKKLKINLVERFARFLMADEPEEQEQLEVKTYALKEDNSVSVAIDESGAVVFSDGREVVDGEYPLEGDLVLVITEGKGEVKQVEAKEGEEPVESPLDASKQFAAIKSMLCEQIAKVKDMFADLAAYTIYPTWDGVFVGIDALGNLWWSDGRTMTNYLLPISYDKAIQIDEFGKGKLIDIVDPYCLRSEVENANNEKAEANSKVEELTAQMEQFSAVKTEMEKTIADLTAEVESLKSQIPSKVGDFNVNKTNEEAKTSRWAVYGE